MGHRPHHRMLLGVVLWATVCLLPARSAAAERLCDPSFENCRTPLLTLIANEHAKIDVAFDEMEDSVIADALINRFKAGVPVRVIADARRNSVSPQNGVILQKLAAAGIPIRVRSVGATMHWKFMLFVRTGNARVRRGELQRRVFHSRPGVQELYRRSDLLHR